MARKKRSDTSQSAMEYLMTYGWAILVVAIVLAALFELGVFSQSPYGVNVCIPSVSYVCTPPALASNGLLSLNIGQAAFATMTVTGIACTNSSVAPQSFTSVSVTIPQDTNASFQAQCPISNFIIGQVFTGYVWLQYNTPFASGQVENIATIEALVRTIGSASAPMSSFSCNGPDTPLVFSTNTVLSNDVIQCGDVTVDSGVTLTTDGYSIITGGNFINMGPIVTGNVTTGPQRPAIDTPAPLDSYGGSGGGGGGTHNDLTTDTYNGVSGQNTLALGGAGGADPVMPQYPGGAGSTPSGPSLSNALIQSWYANEISTSTPIGITFLAGGNGTEGGIDLFHAGSPASLYPIGTAGIYIQAGNLDAGAIYAAGGDGVGGQCEPTACDGSAGGGGGGAIVLAYGNGGYAPGSYTVSGGTGGAEGGELLTYDVYWSSGGNGGDCAVYTFSYGSTPPITP